jgi:hypothetical protein
MDIEIGTNVYRNTNGIIEVQGVPQLEVSLKVSGVSPIRLNYAHFDGSGKMTAKVVDSAFAINERGTLQIAKSPTELVVKNTETGGTVLHMELTAPDAVAIRRAEFMTIKGQKLEVTAEEWRVDRQRSARSTNDAKGGAVAIG